VYDLGVAVAGLLGVIELVEEVNLDIRFLSVVRLILNLV
jgi:hypothetical protein